jgi:hypothetical protein
MKDKWYILKLHASRREISGPVVDDEVVESLRSGELTWADLAFRPDIDSEWKRLYDVAEFRPFQPPMPSPEKLQGYMTRCRDHIESTRPKTDGDRSAYPEAPKDEDLANEIPAPSGAVFLRSSLAERGPFEPSDLQKEVARMGTAEQVYVWYEGLRTWAPIQDIPGFAHLRFAHPIARGKDDRRFVRVVYGRETRSDERKSLVAAVALTSSKSGSGFAVCLDVSSTGMQIRLQDPMPLQTGDTVTLAVTPLHTLGLPKIEARAKVVWVSASDFRVGLFFLEVLGEGQAALEKHLFRQRPLK